MVYILKHKNEAFKTFKQWKELIENQTGKRIERLRKNNGLEYLDGEFAEFCRNNGIARHKTIRKTPQPEGHLKKGNVGKFAC